MKTSSPRSFKHHPHDYSGLRNRTIGSVNEAAAEAAANRRNVMLEKIKHRQKRQTPPQSSSSSSSLQSTLPSSSSSASLTTIENHSRSGNDTASIPGTPSRRRPRRRSLSSSPCSTPTRRLAEYHLMNGLVVQEADDDEDQQQQQKELELPQNGNEENPSDIKNEEVVKNNQGGTGGALAPADGDNKFTGVDVSNLPAPPSIKRTAARSKRSLIDSDTDLTFPSECGKQDHCKKDNTTGGGRDPEAGSNANNAATPWHMMLFENGINGCFECGAPAYDSLSGCISSESLHNLSVAYKAFL